MPSFKPPPLQNAARRTPHAHRHKHHSLTTKPLTPSLTDSPTASALDFRLHGRAEARKPILRGLILPPQSVQEGGLALAQVLKLLVLVDETERQHASGRHERHVAEPMLLALQPLPECDVALPDGAHRCSTTQTPDCNARKTNSPSSS
jgi:hypothetical protein